MRIILGFIGMTLSFLLLVYRVRVREFMGQIRWAEEKLGPGGTYAALVLAALLGFIFSLMYMTNSFDLIFGGNRVDFFESAQ